MEVPEHDRKPAFYLLFPPSPLSTLHGMEARRNRCKRNVSPVEAYALFLRGSSFDVPWLLLREARLDWEEIGREGFLMALSY
jgi:hypothetical protein